MLRLDKSNYLPTHILDPYVSSLIPLSNLQSFRSPSLESYSLFLNDLQFPSVGLITGDPFPSTFSSSEEHLVPHSFHSLGLFYSFRCHFGIFGQYSSFHIRNRQSFS